MAYKKKTNDALLKLKSAVKDGRLEPMYLFFGEEDYLKELYVEKIKALMPDGGFPDFNRLEFEGKDNPLSAYDDAWESFPMMTDKKLIIIKDSEIFNRPNEETKNFWQNKFKHVSDDTVVVFCETKVDKRSVTYKAFAKSGTVVEFAFQSDADLTTWVNKQALNAKIKISKDTAAYFVNVCDKGINSLKNELDKLFAYCDGEITKSDIDKVVSKSLEVQVFDLTDAIMAGDAAKAMEVAGSIRTSNQSAMGMLYLVNSSAEKLLLAKTMSGKSVGEIASAMGTAPFIAGKYADSAKGFSEEALVRMVKRVPEIDYEIKLGKADMRTAVEQYIAECIHYRN